MRSIVANACGERTKCAASAPSGLVSSPKRPSPRSRASSSSRPFHASSWARVDGVMGVLRKLSQFTIGDAGLGIKRIDMRLHLWIGGVVLRARGPPGSGARMVRHVFVLLRGAAGDAIGADHFVAFENRRGPAAGGNAAIGHGGKTDQELRVSFLEPLLD